MKKIVKFLEKTVTFLLFYILMLSLGWALINIVCIPLDCKLEFDDVIDTDYSTSYFALMFVVTLQLYVRALQK
jgi:hypothetical protein